MEAAKEDWQGGQAAGALLRPTYLDPLLNHYSVILLLQLLQPVDPLDPPRLVTYSDTLSY